MKDIQHMSDTYNFQLLHCLLTHVHPSGLLHLHQAQVLQRGEKETKFGLISEMFS